MAYQNIGTPRFYVNDIYYSKAIGLFNDLTDYSSEPQDIGKIASGSPTDVFRYEGTNAERVAYIIEHLNYTTGTDSNHRYYALLGHNLHSGDFGFRHHWMEASDADNGTSTDSSVLINGSVGNFSWYGDIAHSPTLRADEDGFSIVTFQDGGNNPYYGMSKLQFVKLDTAGDPYVPLHIGEVFLGSFYDMPHSPDLSLKLSFEYDGVKNIQTRGGATLSNATYIKPADWGDGGAWQLGSDDNGNPIDNLRSGRRVWDLSFSYISDSDLMPKVAATSNLESGYAEGTPVSEDTLLESTDFFSSVWNKTLGGHLPFIFQANNSKTNPDQFALCRFDMNTLTYDQVANNVYNVKLKIREVW